MTRFVAFLRGINVGGHVVVNERLQEVFEGSGFEDVITFRQSGNVIFGMKGSNPRDARLRLEGALRKSLGYDVPVFLRTFAQLKGIVDSAPRRRVDPGSSLLVTLLPSPPPRVSLHLPLVIPKTSVEVISATKSEVFSLSHGGGESALPNPFVESKLGVKATTRNMNVIREIQARFASAP